MDNVVGTCNILNFARTIDNLKCFLYFSTDEIFGPAPDGVQFDEYDRYNSTNPYSAAKAGGEELAVAFRNTYKIPIVVTHTMNVFGDKQHPEKFIPKCISFIESGKTIDIHSNESQTKPGSRFYIHAEDVSDAVLFIIKNNDFSNFNEMMCPKFNIVGTDEIDNLELANIIADVMGKTLKYNLVDFHSSRPGHDLRYALSGKRLADLGWVQKHPFRVRIKETVESYLKNPTLL
jgi:dTDP-glucose 4,6-dehydratase